MIVNFLATGILGLVNWITGLLPTGNAWNPDTSAVSSWLGSAYAVDAYLPITELFICAGIGIAIMNARVPFAVANWVWRRIRG